MRFTVLTATYNRAHTLVETYRSLCAQTFRDFEWVIVDDGSTDETRGLVASWRPFFPIKYSWKPNGGKHTAINVGMLQAAGEFTLNLDSDDCLVPHALERFDFRSKEPPEPSRIAVFACPFYRRDRITVHGNPIPADRLDVDDLATFLKLCSADRLDMVRTQVFRQFRYPTFPFERYVPDGLVWNRVLRRFPYRFFNEPLGIVGYAPGHMSARHQLLTGPKAGLLYYSELARASVPLALRVRSFWLASICFSQLPGSLTSSSKIGCDPSADTTRAPRVGRVPRLARHFMV
jgi:glycosyltransferase involved in cell wall biosynthesis